MGGATAAAAEGGGAGEELRCSAIACSSSSPWGKEKVFWNKATDFYSSNGGSCSQVQPLTKGQRGCPSSEVRRVLAIYKTVSIWDPGKCPLLRGCPLFEMSFT